MDSAVPEHRFSVPKRTHEQLHTVTSGTVTTPFNRLLSLFSEGGSTSQVPWPAQEGRDSGTSVAPKPVLTAAQKQELAAAGARADKAKRGNKRRSPSEDGTGACAEEAGDEEELDMSRLSPEEREQLAKADSKEAKRLRRLLRNRCSAQLARERRKAYVSELEAKVAAHEKRVEELESKLAATEQQNGTLRRIIRTMRPAEGTEPVELPPVDAVRLRQKAAAAAAAAAMEAAGAEADGAADGAMEAPGGDMSGDEDVPMEDAAMASMPLQQQQQQQLEKEQRAVPMLQAAPQLAPMAAAPPAPVLVPAMRMSPPEPATPQLPAARQPHQELLRLLQEQAQEYQQQQLEQQRQRVLQQQALQQQAHMQQQQVQQQQQQLHEVPQLPPLPPASRPVQLSSRQQMEHSMDMGPFSVAYRASVEAAKLQQQREQQQGQEEQLLLLQQQRELQQEQQGRRERQQRQQQQQKDQERQSSMAGMQFDCDPSALFSRGAMPVAVMPKSQLQQLLMQQQAQMQQQQQQQQQMYAQRAPQQGRSSSSFDGQPSHSQARSHGNSGAHVVPTNSFHVAPSSSMHGHGGSRNRPGHNSHAHHQQQQQQQQQQEALPSKQYEQYSSYNNPGLYDAEAVAQKYSDALGVVPKRHRSHGHGRRAREVVHVVPDVGAMAFPPDELLAALLSA